MALEFKKRVRSYSPVQWPKLPTNLFQFPEAFKEYKTLCTRSAARATKKNLLGTALLITHEPQIGPPEELTNMQNEGIYIGCLFTSEGYGKNVDPPDKILENTAKALKHLAPQIHELKRQEEESEVEMSYIGTFGEKRTKRVLPANRERRTSLRGCRAVRINSGKFGVPWKKTKKVFEDGPLDILVMRREGEAAESEDDTDSEAEDGNDEQEGEQSVKREDEDKEDEDKIKMEEDGDIKSEREDDIKSEGDDIKSEEENDIKSEEGTEEVGSAEEESSQDDAEDDLLDRAHAKMIVTRKPRGRKRDSQGRFVSRPPTPDFGLWPLHQRRSRARG